MFYEYGSEFDGRFKIFIEPKTNYTMNLKNSFMLIAIVSLFANCSEAQNREERMLSSFSKIKSGTSFNLFAKQGSSEKVIIEAASDDISNILTEISGGTLKIFTKNNNWFGNSGYRNINVYVTYTNLDGIWSTGSGDVTIEGQMSGPSIEIHSSGSGDIHAEASIESEGDVNIRSSGSGNCRIQSTVRSGREVEIQNSGSGNITLANIEADKLSSHNSGSGNMKIHGGRVSHQSVSMSGSASYKAQDLVSETCEVRKSGSGSVYVDVINQLTGRSSGSGNIYLKRTSAKIDFKSTGSTKIRHL